MIHECNVNCRTMDILTSEALNIEDPGKWLPFFINLEQIYGAKMASDDLDDMAFNCTTIYCYDGDAYVIDTPFGEFKKIFLEYKNQTK